MIKKIQTLIASVACVAFSTTYEAQEKPKEWDINLYGWARVDYIFDSRQTANVRELQLNLYPLDERLDANGKDVNATGGSNFVSLVTRLGVRFKGPDVWGAKISGNIEGDFFGNTAAYIGLLRLRHATIKMDWPKTSLLMGQTWKPAFVTDVFPGVANFSTGILFNPFGWGGQIRIKQNFTPEVSAELTAYKDREFTSPTVLESADNGAVTNSISFNSFVPIMNAHLQYKSKTVVAGVQFEYQHLKPSIAQTVAGVTKVSDKALSAPAVIGYFKYSDAKIFFKAYGISGQNLSHHVMLGGYASYTGTDGMNYYKASKTNAFWTEIGSNHATVAPAVFFAYTNNKGFTDSGYNKLYYSYGTSTNNTAGKTRVVDNIWRIAARVDFKKNKFKLTPELEYTGTTWGDFATPANGTADGNKKTVGNFRGMVSATYSF